MTSPRLCACGCGADLTGKPAHAKFLDRNHKQQEYRNRGEIRRPLEEPQGDDAPPDIAITKAKIALEDLEIRKIQKEREDLELKKLQGEFVPLVEVEGEAKSAYIAYRTHTLGLTSRFRNRHPSLSMEIIDDHEAMCHEMLAEFVKQQSEQDDEDEDSESP